MLCFMFAKSHEDGWYRMGAPRASFGGEGSGGPLGLEVDLNAAVELKGISHPRGEPDAPRGCDAPAPNSKPGRVDMRRLEQLRHAERRLRPLRRTALARTYWQVYEEMNRVAWALYREERARLGGSGANDL